MCDAANADNRSNTLWMARRECVNEAGAVGVADHRRPLHSSEVQHGDDVRDVLVEPVCLQVLRLIAQSVAAVVEQ